MRGTLAQTIPNAQRRRCTSTNTARYARERDDGPRLDSALVAQFLYGDTLAFGRILERHYARIQKYCYGVLRSADKAEEATQEVFARVLEKLHTLRHGERLEAWLKSIAWHHCLDVVEHERAYVDEMDVAENIRSADKNPEQHLLASERRQFITELIERLPLRQRIVFRMMYMDDYTYKEIETATGLSNRQVKSYLQNARRTVKQAVSKSALQRRHRGTTLENLSCNPHHS